MTKKSTLRNPWMFNNFLLYTRTTSRNCPNYGKLVKRIKREPDLVNPNDWYDWDMDRILVGKHCVHHGVEEHKQTDNLNKPFQFNNGQRDSTREYLKADNFKIEHTTLNYSFNDRKGVWKDGEYSINPVTDNYGKFLKHVSRLKKTNKTLGKGSFLYVIYTKNVKYFSVINFTHSDYVLGKKELRYGNDLIIHLENASKILEPCFNELLLFMIQGYIRSDFKTLYHYLTQGVGEDLIRLDDCEKVLSEKFKEIGPTVPLWLALKDAMEWVLECIHFDTILEEAVFNKKRESSASYKEFVKLVQDGSIFNHLAEIIREQYFKYTMDYVEQRASLN